MFLFGAKIHLFIQTDHILSVLWNAQHRLNRHGAVHQADAGVGGVAVYACVFFVLLLLVYFASLLLVYFVLLLLVFDAKDT